MIKTKIKSFTDLEILHLSHNIVLEIYFITDSFPTKEQFRLTSQLIRAAYSIPANIAEGMGKYSRKELIQFLIISRGSAEEVKYYLILAKDLKYINDETFEKLNNKIIIVGK